MEWRVGDRVATVPGRTEKSEVDAAWVAKLSKPRLGTIIEVPLFCRTENYGTIKVEWDSLVGEKGDLSNWQKWVHTDAIRKHVEDTPNDQ